MRNVIGLLLASGSILAAPGRGYGQSPHDVAGVGAMGLIGRGVTADERPTAVGPLSDRAAPVSIAPTVVVPVVRPAIVPSQPPPVATSAARGAVRGTPPARTPDRDRSWPVGGRDPARQPALARGNPYTGYDRGWLHGYWEITLGRASARRASVGVGPGAGSGWGLPAWLIGPMIYRWGYRRYHNPFIEGPGTVDPRGSSAGDSSRPVDVLSPPPTEAVLHDAMEGFREAREAFRREDYTRALQLAERSLGLLPNDPAIREFRGQTLLALHRYREAAVALHAAIAVVPGWDWPTLLNLYGNPETYTRQLRMLETYAEKNPRSAAGHFLLAVQYLSTGYAEAAAGQFRQAAALEPEDSLIARLARTLQGEEPGAATPAAAGPRESGDLSGAWVARPRGETTITLVMQPRGHLRWRVDERGRTREYEGFSLYVDGILTLTQFPDETMAGRILWRDSRHFTFKILEGRPDEPGLSFEKSS